MLTAAEVNVCAIAHCWHGQPQTCCRCARVRPMLIMVSNQTGIEFGLLAGLYPGRIGHMYSPGGERGPYPGIDFALDNDAWPAFANGRPRDEAGHVKLLNWTLMSGVMPRFALVPDAVGDRDTTLRLWDQWAPRMKAMGFRLGFAAQNKMTFSDVPDDDCIIFLGGDDKWKDAAIAPWCAKFPNRVHVGRVNGWPRLVASWRAGAVSIDGTGWFHKGTGGYSQANDLRKFLRETATADLRTA